MTEQVENLLRGARNTAEHRGGRVWRQARRPRRFSLNRKGNTMKRILFAAALIAAISPAYACSDERWNYLSVGSAKFNQKAVAAHRYAQDDPQTYIDTVQTLTEWVAALEECGAERQAGNLE